MKTTKEKTNQTTELTANGHPVCAIMMPLYGDGPQGQPWHDHETDWFWVQKKLFEKWDLTQGCVYNRLKRGWNVEDALTIRPNHTPTAIACTDELGNTFESKNEMFETYGISRQSFRYQYLIKGLSQQEALTYDPNKRYQDHAGNYFRTIKQMCDFWGVTDYQYRKTLKATGSLEKALTTGAGRSKGYTDHTGQTFRTKSAMCETWGLDLSLYQARIHKGMSQKDALETPVIRRGEYIRKHDDNAKKQKIPCAETCSDHQGNTFPSIRKMCDHWGVSIATFRYRKSKDLPLEQCLTGIKREAKKTETFQVAKPVCSERPVGCRDHKGNWFHTEREMCDYWGVHYTTYISHIKQGDSLENALHAKRKPCYDHLGHEFKNKSEMCRFWKVNLTTFNQRLTYGLTLEEALTKPLNTKRKFKETAA